MLTELNKIEKMYQISVVCKYAYLHGGRDNIQSNINKAANYALQNVHNKVTKCALITFYDCLRLIYMRGKGILQNRCSG